jgi:crossover junction endodeoxyribonuclease RuvC
MYDTFIGIDPGKSGAVAVINSVPEGNSIDAFDVPVVKGTKGAPSYDTSAMVSILTKLIDGRQPYAMIESVHAMPGQGVTSMFNFGMGYGLWLGIVAALKIPYTLVSPVRWKKAMLTDVRQDKGVSRLRAKQLFPAQAELFDRVKDDGRAEAILMAEFGRRQLTAAAIVGQALAQAS